MAIKKALRSLQVHFPSLLETKYRVARLLRSWLRIPFERDFRAIPLLNPPPGALFLDVGANRGQSTEAILLMHPAATVQMFEPNALLHDRLVRLFAGKTPVTVHNYGLAEAPSEAPLYVPFYKRWMFDGLASFDEKEAREWLRGQLYFFDPALLRLEKSTCSLRRLDDLALRPFLIKIDVQGFELNVLKGGRETLATHHPVLLIEAPGEPIVDFLRELDYEPAAYAGKGFKLGAFGSLNTFFLPSSHALRGGTPA